MNPAAETAPVPDNLAPPHPPQAHRPSTSCDRHPDERFTGFCPSCLCERLAVLDQSSNNNSNASSSSRRPAISAAALKAIFKPSGSGGAPSSNGRVRSGFFPELRRTKSFSASKNEGFAGVCEPQRRSCDVRVRSTLWNLFSQDEDRNASRAANGGGGGGGGGGVGVGGEPEVEPRKSSVRDPVIESQEEGKVESESEQDGDDGSGGSGGGDVVAPKEPSNVTEERVQEIVEEEEEVKIEEEAVLERESEVHEEDLKPMKDHIDLDSQAKKPSGRDLKEIAGSFWSAASVFSKKLQKWRQKQKMKKRRNAARDGGGSARLPVEKPIGRQFRDTQSEIADYGYGRRSCDTDPRFSLDAGRFSLDASRFSIDDPRYSFDEPRASWDGYLIGRPNMPARMPTMLSVVEDAPVHHVARSDTQIPVEEPPPPPPNAEQDLVPGGTAQTRDYYSDSTLRRRKSLDRSNSIRKAAASVVAEIDELKSVSKISPAENRESCSTSLRDDCSYVESFEQSFAGKKPRLWGKAWKLLGFMHRRSKYEEDEDEDEKFSRSNGMERSLSGTWHDRNGLGPCVNHNGSHYCHNNPKLMRSNSSVSWRGSAGGFGIPARKSDAEANGGGGGGFRVLDRNRSSRYSPGNGDSGLLRFYLAPTKGGGRGAGGWEKARPGHPAMAPPVMARSVMRLY